MEAREGDLDWAFLIMEWTLGRYKTDPHLIFTCTAKFTIFQTYSHVTKCKELQTMKNKEQEEKKQNKKQASSSTFPHPMFLASQGSKQKCSSSKDEDQCVT